MNTKRLWMKNWQFSKVAGINETKPADFQPVELPHDWLIENTQALYEDSVGWYRTSMNYEGEGRMLIRFDGVYMDSTLYVNGRQAGEWKYGYSAFEHDLTDYLVKGSNEIELKVVHQAPNSRWYTGAGIYRDVWLIKRSDSYIHSDGVYISTEKTDDKYTIEIDTEVTLKNNPDAQYEMSHRLMGGEKVLKKTAQALDGSGVVKAKMSGLSVKEWSPESPHLYMLKTELRTIDGEEIIESQSQTVGFKTVEMLPDEGLRLNGQPYKLKGVCEHHDLGALGAAFNPEALKRRLKLLMEMGVNAIRTSHNMPAKQLMELADEWGFLIVSESFDMWEKPKTRYDYARFFKEWAYKDVKSWLRRDRNHVSLLMWTIGNEIYDTHADERGLELTRQLKAWVEQFDYRKNAAITIGSNYLPWENAQKSADILKVVGYNYGEKYYDSHHENYPDWVIYGSETGSVVQSRGVYHFPYSQSVLADDDEQCSALGNSSTSWGARSPESILTGERDNPYSMGQFVWTGFDYIGEPTPYHTKNAYFGQLDTATFPKDSYYIYQSAWVPFEKKPVLHLFPYWDFNPGQTIDVRVATNAPSVALYLNDRKIEQRDIDHQRDKEITPTWQVPYEPGELKAVAFDKEGQKVKEVSRHSFEDSRLIVLSPDKMELTADSRDLSFIEISTVDEHGRPVENAADRINLTVSGPGRLVGFDNGDSTDFDQYKGRSRRLFNGKAMAIIQSTKETGAITLSAQSEGLPLAEVSLQATDSSEQIIEYESLHSNKERSVVTGHTRERPVRKVELTSPDGLILSPEQTELIVKAKLYPTDTDYTDVQWSVVNDAGVEATNAEIKSDGLQAKVRAKGDGTFRVRCTSRNGTDKIRLISELDMNVTGMGTAYKNPYELISGSLFDDSAGEVTNGNERGIATSRDSRTVVGYHAIDFGRFGSNQVILPLFALSSEEYVIDIWEGHPDKPESTHLLEAHYQKESKWNVYQEETYTLPKRLKGITALYFVMHAKVHLKGFYFEQINRAMAYNPATEADSIYGDAFERTSTGVYGIGNNVSLVFEEMDFSQTPASSILIEGDSPIEKNTIHIHFQYENGESVNQAVEFTESEGTVSKTFIIEELSGKGTVTFVFLPGSHFDFKGFRFEEYSTS